MTEIKPLDVSAKKPWYKSKIIWFNAICAMLTALEVSMNLIQPHIPGNVYGWVLLFVTMINAFLRVITSQAISKPQINGLFSNQKRPEGGFITADFLPYLIVGVASVAFIYGVYAMGESAERSRWELKETKATAIANLKILDLQNQKYDLEQKRINEQAELTAKHQKEIKAHEEKEKNLNAQLRAGTLKLRIAAVRTADCGSATSEASAPDGGAEDTYSAELARAPSEFLVHEFAERDKLAVRFNTCIEQLHKDRGLPFTNPYQLGEIE